MPTPTPAATRPPAWVWPWRPGPRVGGVAARWAAAADRLAFGRWWAVVAVAVGVVPVLLGSAVGSSAHQPVTGLLLTPLFAACLVRDRPGRAAGVVALAVGAHSAVVVALAAHDPGAAAILPGSAAYWERTRHWITTGEDGEYRWEHWLPAHAALLVAVPVGAYLSFGAVPFAVGLEQVDLMNYYVGRLVAGSESPARAVLFGWHPWSVVRGVAYTVLTFEVASWSLQRLTGRPLSTRRTRQRRWALGLALAVLDAVVKLLLAPVVREQLFLNLRPGGA